MMYLTGPSNTAACLAQDIEILESEHSEQFRAEIEKYLKEAGLK